MIPTMLNGVRISIGFWELKVELSHAVVDSLLCPKKKYGQLANLEVKEANAERCGTMKKVKQGFAALSKEQRKKIASLGGQARTKQGTNFVDRKLASRAGKLGYESMIKKLKEGKS